MSETESSAKEPERTDSVENWLATVGEHRDTLKRLAESDDPDSCTAGKLLEWEQLDNPTREDLCRILSRSESEDAFGLALPGSRIRVEKRVVRVLRRVRG